jgi:hypothetical protein
MLGAHSRQRSSVTTLDVHERRRPSRTTGDAADDELERVSLTPAWIVAERGPQPVTLGAGRGPARHGAPAFLGSTTASGIAFRFSHQAGSFLP